MTVDTTEVLIVGGGIAGAACALALGNEGIESVVLEQAPELGEIGAGLQMAPNALRALDRLGIVDEVRADAVHPPQAVMMNAVTGKRITALDFGAGFLERFGYPYIVTHRGDLHAALLRSALATGKVDLRTNCHVATVRDHDAHAEVITTDGKIHRGRIVVGADGLHSVVRQYTVGDGAPRRSADVAYRGTMPAAEVAAHEGLGNMMWWVGPGMHLVQYPIRRSELFNQVAVFTSPRADPATEGWGTPDELNELFGDKFEFVRASAERVQTDSWWHLYDRDPAPSWSKGRVTLMGDAAHPLLQYLGQGACLSLEDAVVLARHISANRDAHDMVFKGYESDRVARTGQAQLWARRVGDIVHGDATVGLLRDELLSQREDTDTALVDWLYGANL